MTTLVVCYMYSGAQAAPGATPFQWPRPSEMLAIAKPFGASVWMHHGLYENGSQYPSYIVPPHARPALRYAIAGAKANEHTICPYTSWFYAAERGLTKTGLLNEVRALKKATGCAGIYIDGMTCPYKGRPWSEYQNQYVAHVLRYNIFGRDGVLILHATHSLGNGSFLPPDPLVEKHMSLVVIGEGCPNWSDQEACKEYIAQQIEPRIDAGIPWAMLNRTWPAEWLVKHGASAIGYVGMKADGAGGTIYDDGTRTKFYQDIMAAREAAGT